MRDLLAAGPSRLLRSHARPVLGCSQNRSAALSIRPNSSSASASSSSTSATTLSASPESSRGSLVPGAPPPGRLSQVIKDSIRSTGPMSVARYMQFCLSHPTEGYYQKGDVFGKKGDFITSPEISQIFGESLNHGPSEFHAVLVAQLLTRAQLVAIWLLTRYIAAGNPPRVRLVELGPGRGTLMDDILRTLFTFPGIGSAIRSIHLVENSGKMRDIQGTKLAPRLEGRGVDLRWSDKIEDVSQTDDFTLLVAHEFFDAMPVNVFEKTPQGYREVLVSSSPTVSSVNPSGLHLALSQEPTPLSTVLPATSPRFARLPIGSRIELAQDSWRIMRKLGEIVGGGTNASARASATSVGESGGSFAVDGVEGAGGRGAGLVIDYGADRVFGSSFRAFRNHKIVDIFDEPGSSDLTANVDFTYLRESLDGLSAKALGPIPQSQFLLSLGLQPRLTKLLASATDDERRSQLQHGAKRLIDSLGMGSQYQVMGVVPASQGETEVYPFPVIESGSSTTTSTTRTQ
ncbi:hypothetical protein EHS25_001055 [Saitozyma podzolica]|uniref:Protein arginine methyltransferase NDUFAF7 n=1 Tax=Saitozyma podzolica TaxID=1890683 RepID=A0A427YHA3_9TREE|nr:hypothetical protein EHS25_001055 [Saitozyma podzolica]